MDSTNQVGKALKNTDVNVNYALAKDFSRNFRVERARDIFDSIIPFEMDFPVDIVNETTTVDLWFYPPPPSCCCTQCNCANCETFSGNDPVLITNHPFIPETVHVFLNDTPTTNYSLTNSTTITLGFTPTITDVVSVCYAYGITIYGSTDCATCGTPLVGNPLTGASTTIFPFPSLGSGIVPTGSTGAFIDGIGSPPPKWAHSTNNTATDESVGNIPIAGVSAVTDGNPLTCSVVPSEVMRGAGTVEVVYLIQFDRPVKLCSFKWSGDIPNHVDIMSPIAPNGSSSDWQQIDYIYTVSTQGFQAEIINSGIPIIALKVVFSQSATEGQLGPFGLWFFSGFNICDFTACVSAVDCVTLLETGLLDVAPIS